MTKEELKGMIDATITENGNKEITGKALNLALNAIVDSISSTFLQIGEPNEDGTLKELTEEQLAANAQLFADITESIDAGKGFPMVRLFIKENTFAYVCNLDIDVEKYVGGVGVVFVSYLFTGHRFILSEDGRVEVRANNSSFNLSTLKLNSHGE